MIKPIALLLICSLFIFSQSISYTCEDNIFDKDNLISNNRRIELCSSIKEKEYSLYLRLIPNIKAYETSDYKANDYYYNSESEDFFDKICKNKCNNSVLITVYYKARKIRITTGSNQSSKVTHDIKDEIISTMGSYLVNNDFDNAFRVAVDKVIKVNSSYFNSFTSSVTDDIFSLFDSAWIIFVIFFIIVILICIFSVPKDQEIHNHICFLNNLLSTIQTNSPRTSNIVKCTLCTKILNESVVYFSCGHIYHQSCLSTSVRIQNKIDSYCLMCDEPTGPITRDPFLNQIVNERNISNILNNFDKLYDKNDLRAYYNKNQPEVERTKIYCSRTCWIYDPFISSPITSNTSSSKSTSGGDYGSSSNNKSTSGGDYGSSSSKKSTSGGNY